MNMEFVNDVASGKITLPAVPRVVIQLVSLLRNPRLGLDPIIKEVEQDPVITVRVLQLANSPYYTGKRSVGSIADAITMLGTDALQRLVLTVGVASAFIEVPGVNLRQFWLDATVTASTARTVAMLSRKTVQWPSRPIWPACCMVVAT